MATKKAAFRAIKNTPIGQSVTVPKGKKTVQEFQRSVQHAKSFYKRQHGIETTAKYDKGHTSVRMTVKARSPDAPAVLDGITRKRRKVEIPVDGLATAEFNGPIPGPTPQAQAVEQQQRDRMESFTEGFIAAVIHQARTEMVVEENAKTLARTLIGRITDVGP